MIGEGAGTIEAENNNKLVGIVADASTIEAPKRTPNIETPNEFIFIENKYPESATPLPSTACTRTAMTALSYADKEKGKLSFERLKARDEELGKNKDITTEEVKREELNKKTHIFETKSKLIYTVKSTGRGERESSYYIEYGEIENLIRRNKPAVKIFYFTMRTALMKYGHNPAEMAGKMISFPLKELVDCGMYSSVRSARRGFETADPILIDIKIGGRDKWKSKEANYIKTCLFSTMAILDGVAFIRLSPDLKWDFVCREYTIIPEWAYGLSFNAFRAITYMYIQARRNVRTLTEKRGITISVKALIRELNLPEPNETKNPKRDIKDPLFNAIKEINTADQNHIKESGITAPFEIKVLSKTELEKSTTDFIENGAFFVKMGSEYINCFSKINSSRNKKIERAIKRKEKINTENKE